MNSNFLRIAWFVIAILMVACQTDPAPSAVSPTPVVQETADLGAAKFPSLEETKRPPVLDAGFDCETRLKAASDLASKCFRLFPDEGACTEFFALLDELREAGCVIPDAGFARDSGVE